MSHFRLNARLVRKFSLKKPYAIQCMESILWTSKQLHRSQTIAGQQRRNFSNSRLWSPKSQLTHTSVHTWKPHNCRMAVLRFSRKTEINQWRLLFLLVRLHCFENTGRLWRTHCLRRWCSDPESTYTVFSLNKFLEIPGNSKQIFQGSFCCCSFGWAQRCFSKASFCLEMQLSVFVRNSFIDHHTTSDSAAFWWVRNAILD